MNEAKKRLDRTGFFFLYWLKLKSDTKFVLKKNIEILNATNLCTQFNYFCQGTSMASFQLLQIFNPKTTIGERGGGVKSTLKWIFSFYKSSDNPYLNILEFSSETSAEYPRWNFFFFSSTWTNTWKVILISEFSYLLCIYAVMWVD